MNKGFINILVVVLVVVIVGAVGYFVLTREQEPETQSMATTTPVATLTPTDETTDWKTYQNKELGLSFRYPKEWGNINVNIRQGLSDVYPEGKGEVILISFTEGSIFVTAYTADFVGYAEIPYAGDKNLVTLCEKPLVAKENTYIVDGQVYTTGARYCNKIMINGKPIYQHVNVGTLPEGDGSFQLTQKALVNLEGKTFKGLSVSQYFPEVVLNAGGAHAQKVYLEKILAKQVSQSILDKINTFEQFIGTFQF